MPTTCSTFKYTVVVVNYFTKWAEAKPLAMISSRKVQELLKVLWAYRTTSRTSTGETPFSLADGVEAMILVEIRVPSLRRETYNQEENFALQRYKLDLLKEKLDLVALKIASYKRQFEKYFNSKVKEMRFKECDLVLRKINSNTKEISARVLGLNWEGPYIIKEVVRPGTYKLKWSDGSLVPRTWNAEHLRPYYQ